MADVVERRVGLILVDTPAGLAQGLVKACACSPTQGIIYVPSSLVTSKVFRCVYVLLVDPEGWVHYIGFG